MKVSDSSESQGFVYSAQNPSKAFQKRDLFPGTSGGILADRLHKRLRVAGGRIEEAACAGHGVQAGHPSEYRYMWHVNIQC